jgi:hypothetical protein
MCIGLAHRDGRNLRIGEFEIRDQPFSGLSCCDSPKTRASKCDRLSETLILLCLKNL